jgi:hypothetical protein
MYIAKLKDGPKRVTKTLNDFGKGFWNGMMEGGGDGITSKRIFEVEVFFSSQNIDFPFYLRRLLELFFTFFFFFFSSFLLCSVSWGLGGFSWYLRRKSLLQKTLFKWHDMKWHGHDYGYTDGGRIFRNGVMHTNIAKPWFWRCGSCGYIGGGCIF